MPDLSQYWTRFSAWIVQFSATLKDWANKNEGVIGLLAFTLAILSSPILFFVFWKPLRRWWRSLRKAPPLPPDTHDRQILLRKVRAHWVEAQRKDNLREQVRLDLKLTELPQAMRSPVTVIAARDSGVPADRPFTGALLDFFESHAAGQLLILGEPGTGKTTLITELADELIGRAEGGPFRHIPVVFNLSSWGYKPAPLVEWMQKELIGAYGISRDRARQWVVADRILPLLDGLDEVAADKRAACVAAINAFRRAKGLHPLAVSCRTTEYAEIAHLELGAALRVEKLTAAAVDEVLAMPKMAASRALIAEDPSLREILDTPLMLNVLYLAARDGVDATAQGPTPGDRLFERYVLSMLRRSLKPEPEQAKVREQLEWLAAQMRERRMSSFSLEDLDFSWPSTLRSLQAAEWFSRILSGLFGGLVGGLAFGLAGGLVGGLIFGLVVGLVIVLSVGLAGELVFGLVFGLEPVDRLSFRPVYLRDGLGLGFYLVVCLIAGLVFWLVGALVAALGFGPLEWREGLAVGLVSTLLVALVTGLKAAIRSARASERSAPNQGTWRSARYALIICAVGLALFVPAGLVVTIIWPGEVGRALSWVLVSTSAAAALLALDKGGAFALRHFAIRLVLSRTTPAPLRLVRFLQDASHNLLLRQRGGAFEFPHLTLRDYLATQWDRR